MIRLPALRAVPTVLRIGLASTLAYRAEIFVWFLAYTMPIIMMALWTAVAREAPIGRFGEAEFCAYFMVTLVVRLVTGSWVVWEMNFEIRSGALAQRMMRPFPPLLAYACENLAAWPMRIVLVIPLVAATLLWLGTGIVTRDPVQLAVGIAAVVLAWVMTFLVMASIGTLALFWESSLSVFDLWLGAFVVFSGYVIPLELFPAGVLAVIRWLPFRFMISFPVETILGSCTRGESLAALAVQAAWCLVFFLILRIAWRAGVRRFAAYGG